VQRIKFYLPDAEPRHVPAFATLAAGFCIAQLGLNDSPPELSSTTMSRPAKMMKRHGNAGERSFARLPTVCVIGVNAGYASPSYAMRLHYAGLLLLQKARSSVS